MTKQKKMRFPARSFLLRLASALAIVFFFAMLARAGGPEYVAGSSYFNSGTMGQPITWSSGEVNYYTDQGDLRVFAKRRRGSRCLPAPKTAGSSLRSE